VSSVLAWLIPPVDGAKIIAAAIHAFGLLVEGVIDD
jgi:hypothetical protein